MATSTWAMATSWTGRRGRTLPHTLGHEIEGTLSAVGPDAQALLEGRKVGDRFVVFPWIGCGECATCKRDQEHICNKPRQIGIQVAGGYAEYVLVPHPKYLLDATGVPEGLAATYMCSGHHRVLGAEEGAQRVRW